MSGPGLEGGGKGAGGFLVEEGAPVEPASPRFYRYRNFRTFTSPQPVQFSSLAVDCSGELVSAGAQDSFEIFLWSMQTGRLLEVRQPLDPQTLSFLRLLAPDLSHLTL